MADLSVANTMLAQLGGNKFLAMTGAKNLVGSDDTLSFQLPRMAGEHKTINGVRITLEPADHYRVEFVHAKRGFYAIVREFEPVYAEQLPQLFERITGLRTRL